MDDYETGDGQRESDQHHDAVQRQTPRGATHLTAGAGHHLGESGVGDVDAGDERSSTDLLQLRNRKLRFLSVAHCLDDLALTIDDRDRGGLLRAGDDVDDGRRSVGACDRLHDLTPGESGSAAVLRGGDDVGLAEGLAGRGVVFDPNRYQTAETARGPCGLLDYQQLIDDRVDQLERGLQRAGQPKNGVEIGLSGFRIVLHDTWVALRFWPMRGGVRFGAQYRQGFMR